MMFIIRKLFSKNGSQNNKKKRTDHSEKRIDTKTLKKILSGNNDIIFSDIYINNNKKLKLTLIYVDGMVDIKTIDDDIVKPLVQGTAFSEGTDEKDVFEQIMRGMVYHLQKTECENIDQCIINILSGSVAIVFDRLEKAVTFEAKGFEKRTIVEPVNENVLKGSKESFIEVLRVNTTLVRRRINSPDLKIAQISVGARTKTKVAVLYLDGVANKNVVNEVMRRLHTIDIDGIVSAGQIEFVLTENKWTMCPQVLYTERVDKLCANIMDGRVGVLIDGMPIAYIVPIDITCFFQAPEDYAQRFYQSSFFRMLRVFCGFLSLVLPAFYVSITTFHHEMIPSNLAVSIIESKEGVPFPTFVEVLLMLFAFEVLLEAGFRLPRAIGQALSIVGALVIGEAAIRARILSPAVVIVIATSGIAGFTSPSQDMANTIRLVRFLLVIFSIIAGLYGLSLGIAFIIFHLCKLETFGVPYLSPYVANDGKGILSDTFIRLPWFTMKKRPTYIKPEDIRRQE